MVKTALIVVDIQNDYFPGGLFEQEGAEAAAEKAFEIIKAFRAHDMPIVHIQHISSPDAPFFVPDSKGVEIYSSVIPLANETLIVKHFPNSFKETGLEAMLREQGVERVVIIGMMTLMCIDATARAAKDLGFEVVVLHDACAARALEFNGVTVPAAHVHAAFLAALNMSYADVQGTEEYIQCLSAV